MLADVEKYFSAIDEAEKEYQEVYALRNSEYTRLTEAVRVAGEKRLAARTTRCANLAESEEPLVKWIAENTLQSFPEHSEIVLRALPATREELDALAAERQWCSDWERLVRRAEEDGAVSPRAKRTKEFEKVMTRLSRDYGAEYTRQLRGELVAAVEAEVKAAQAKVAAE